MTQGAELCLQARVQPDGINFFVDLPPEALRDFPPLRPLPVLLQLRDPQGAWGPGQGWRHPDAARLQAIARLSAEGWFRSSVLHRQNAPPRLYLDRWMRQLANVGKGETVTLRLRPDPDPRRVAEPAALRWELERDAALQAAWQALPENKRKEICTALQFIKTPAAAERQVAKFLQQLRQP